MGTLSGKGVEVVKMMERRRLEVLCVQETIWRGNTARMMVGGRKRLHAGGDGRSSGVGILYQKRSVRRSSELKAGMGESSWHGL